MMPIAPRLRHRGFAACGSAVVLAASVAVAFAQKQPDAPAERVEIPPLEELQATRERPLFAPSRRPDAVETPDTEATPVQEAAALPFELTGIVLGSDFRAAILRNKTTQEEVRLRVGEALEAWSIEEIASRFILLRGEAKRVRLRIYDDSAKAGIQVSRPEGRQEEVPVPAESDKDVEEIMPSEAPHPQGPGPALERRPPRPPPQAVPPPSGAQSPKVQRQQIRRGARAGISFPPQQRRQQR